MDNNRYWWKASPNSAHKTVFEYLKRLDQAQSYRQADNFKHMRLYGNMEPLGLRYYRSSFQSPTPDSTQNRVTLNIVQSMIDTVNSKITKNKPKPSFMTNGGDWSQQSRAKKLTQFVEGQFQSTDFYSKAAKAFKMGCIFGTGPLKIFKQHGEICVEPTFTDEIIVDDSDAVYGEPRQMHQKKYIHKDVLSEMFPDKKGSIEMIAREAIVNLASSVPTDSDMILVCESWHLPSGPEAKDGKHTICIENETLFEEEYCKNYFPFVFFRWNLRPLGFFGQSLTEQLSGLQLEINKILRTIQVSMHLVSVPKLLVEAGSKIVDAHLDNRIGGIIKYSGTAPTPGQLGTIPPELFSHLDRLYQRAFEIAGVSQLSATSSKPAGLNSGKALREYNDLETERFMDVAMRYEKVYMDAAKIMIDLAKELDEELDGGYKVRVKGKKFLDTIKWKDVQLDEDKYVMSVFPTSALSSTPAARLQDVQELIQAGFVNREDAIKLLDFPDLQAYYNYETAPGEDIDMVIEKIIEDGEYLTPEPYQNLEYGIIKIQKAYLLFRSQGAPEEKLELLRRWIEDARALIERATVDSTRQMMEVETSVQQLAQEQAAQNGAILPEEAAAPEDMTNTVTAPEGMQ
jgi:hypothetical protein